MLACIQSTGCALQYIYSQQACTLLLEGSSSDAPFDWDGRDRDDAREREEVESGGEHDVRVYRDGRINGMADSKQRRADSTQK